MTNIWHHNIQCTSQCNSTTLLLCCRAISLASQPFIPIAILVKGWFSRVVQPQIRPETCAELRKNRVCVLLSCTHTCIGCHIVRLTTRTFWTWQHVVSHFRGVHFTSKLMFEKFPEISVNPAGYEYLWIFHDTSVYLKPGSPDFPDTSIFVSGYFHTQTFQISDPWAKSISVSSWYAQVAAQSIQGQMNKSLSIRSFACSA